MAFSRYMRVDREPRWPVGDRPLRMLLVACNPQGLESFGLPPIDVYLEHAILKEATLRLGWLLELDKLIGAPTLADVRERQATGRFHILHLLAHAVAKGDQGAMILADTEGAAVPVPGEEVAKAVASAADQSPYLVFLATPQGNAPPPGDAGRVPGVTLAPVFVQAGCQAAVAVQASIRKDRLHRFTESFYAVLIRTGVIDVALALARAEVYEPGDWEWTYPVLYMGTSDAQLFRPLPESLEKAVSNLSFEVPT